MVLETRKSKTQVPGVTSGEAPADGTSTVSSRGLSLWHFGFSLSVFLYKDTSPVVPGAQAHASFNFDHIPEGPGSTHSPQWDEDPACGL